MFTCLSAAGLGGVCADLITEFIQDATLQPDSRRAVVCSPGADAVSVWYRASMLGMLMKMMPGLLAQWIHDGQPDDAVFQVAATFPMEKMRTGVVREGPLFDVDEFVKQVGAQA